ncbi:hypothetical protein BCR35DRAFT_306815 [Leucosporidium creatinivorum]|uniref:RRM domain-containing protein n=1 Tax=Leucosporidium creatinivorum TaxID=106004 RepID=A0A1Y2ER74_9BASI|nr:hypothetical protein BCR35DRAFT_306815 [Leucosporidium creatinivorum]
MGTEDPFPLFHLAELDFTVTASTISSLAAHQLPLAQYSTDYSETLEKPLKKAWRQRRERARARMGQPIGVHASEADKQADPLFTRFECIGLDFALTSLRDLTSAQLACVAFHPDANADLVETAEEIFFARRERDFSAGLSLPPPPPRVSAPAPAPTPVAAPLTPTAVLPPRPEIALPAFNPAPPAAPLNPIATPSTAPPLPTPVSVPAKSGAAAWLDDVEMEDSPAVDPAPKKVISLEEWRLQQREKEGGARSVHEDARSSSSKTGRRSERGEKRDREGSPRGSESSARRRKTEGAQSWLDDSPRARRESLERESRREERDERRDVRRDDRDSRRDVRDEGYGSRERRLSEGGYGLRDDASRGYDDGGRRADDEKRDDRREGWSRLPLDERSSSGPSPYKTRAAPPTGPANPRGHLSSLPPPPSPPPPPREQDDLPSELTQSLKIVFIRQIPENNTLGDIIRLLQSFHQVAPAGVKLVRNNVPPSLHTGARLVNAYAAYEDAADAQTIKQRLNGFVLAGEHLQAVDGLPPLNHDGTPKTTGVWKWTFMTPRFRRDYHRRQLDRYHSEQSMSSRPRYPDLHQPSRPTFDTRSQGRTIGKDNLPKDISESLYQLYVSGFPLDVKIEELRDFVDHLDGLVGIGVSSEKSISKHRRCAAWFAFTKWADCENACSALQGKRFEERAPEPLTVEIARDKQRRTYWDWADMSKSFRKEHKGPSTQSTPQMPPQPVFQPVFPPEPFAPTSRYAATLVIPPSNSTQAHQLPNGGSMQAPPPSLEPKESAPSRGFVHPSRLALMDTKPVLPDAGNSQDDDEDDDEMIIVEASSSADRRPPPPTLTGANAAASSAAVKNIEDAWASRRRASTQAQRAEPEMSSSASRQGSVASAVQSPSPHKPSLPTSNTTVSDFIQQAVTEGEVSSARAAAASPAPDVGSLSTRLEPPPRMLRQNSAQRSPPLPPSLSLPRSSLPTGPSAFTGRLPPPTGPRSLAIKGANRSPPLSAIPTGPKALNAPRGPKVNTPNGGIVLSVAGGASMRRNSASSASQGQPQAPSTLMSNAQDPNKVEVVKSPSVPVAPSVEANGAIEAEKEGEKGSSVVEAAEVEVDESLKTIAEANGREHKDSTEEETAPAVENGVSVAGTKEELGTKAVPVRGDSEMNEGGK